MRKWIAVAVLAVLAIGVFLLLGRTRLEQKQVQATDAASASSPPVLTAPVEAAGDPESASESGSLGTERKKAIVNAAFACRRMDSLLQMARAQAGPDESNPESRLTEVQRTNLAKAKEECASDAAARTAPIGELLVDLARRGNAAAASCYVSGAYVAQGHEPQARGTQYAQIVPSLVRSGIAAGDWSMVAIAASINGRRMANSPYLSLPPPDAKLEYAYMKLMELGAVGAEKADMQMILVDMAKKLSPADRKSAESSAEELFRAHFAQGAPYKQSAQPLCEGV